MAGHRVTWSWSRLYCFCFSAAPRMGAWKRMEEDWVRFVISTLSLSAFALVLFPVVVTVYLERSLRCVAVRMPFCAAQLNFVK